MVAERLYAKKVNRLCMGFLEVGRLGGFRIHRAKQWSDSAGLVLSSAFSNPNRMAPIRDPDFSFFLNRQQILLVIRTGSQLLKECLSMTGRMDKTYCSLPNLQAKW